jgi:hypothetical protein
MRVRHSLLICFVLLGLLALPVTMLLYLVAYGKGAMVSGAAGIGLAGLDPRAVWGSLSAYAVDQSSGVAWQQRLLLDRLWEYFLRALKWLGLLSPGTVIPTRSRDPFPAPPLPSPPSPGKPDQDPLPWPPSPPSPGKPGQDPFTNPFFVDVPQNYDGTWHKILGEANDDAHQ